MGRLLSAFAMMIAVFVGSNAAAQNSAPPPAPSAQPTQISDDELQTFANIYNALQDTKSKHEAMLASAKTDEEAGKIRASFDQETAATLSRQGWTADKFNSFVTTINSDPALAARASALIKH